MFVLGCILVEMHTGEALFAGQKEEDQMSRIIEVLGMPPRRMIEASKVKHKFFKKDKNGNWICREVKNSRNFLPGTRRLEEILGVSKGGPGERRRGEAGHRYIYIYTPRVINRTIVNRITKNFWTCSFEC